MENLQSHAKSFALRNQNRSKRHNEKSDCIELLFTSMYCEFTCIVMNIKYIYLNHTISPPRNPMSHDIHPILLAPSCVHMRFAPVHGNTPSASRAEVACLQDRRNSQGPRQCSKRASPEIHGKKLENAERFFSTIYFVLVGHTSMWYDLIFLFFSPW